MSKIFIDTNILIYSLDQHDKKKRNASRKLLNSLLSEHTAVISTQVMQEFYVVATTKLHADPLIVKNILHSFQQFEVVTITTELIKDAIDCSILYQLSFWDALIVTSAEYGKCEQLWTEDLNDGQLIRGVLITNPIKPLLTKGNL